MRICCIRFHYYYTVNLFHWILLLITTKWICCLAAHHHPSVCIELHNHSYRADQLCCSHWTAWLHKWFYRLLFTDPSLLSGCVYLSHSTTASSQSVLGLSVLRFTYWFKIIFCAWAKTHSGWESRQRKGPGWVVGYTCMIHSVTSENCHADNWVIGYTWYTR